MAGYEILYGNDKHGIYIEELFPVKHKKGYEWSRWFHFLFVLFLSCSFRIFICIKNNSFI